nr:tripartite tricarboxylate transporter substrate binding protein [Pseudomonas sp.]
MKRRTLAALAALACAGILPGIASAQSDYPNKPIKVIVPFPPGSGTDNSARYVGQKLSDVLGQSVVVENKPGASGFIAAQAVAEAPPDGYTLFITTMTTQSVNPHLFKKLPYDPVKDFEPVSIISASPLLLIVRNDESSPKSLAELTERAKQAPGKLTFASGNTSSRVSAEMYAAQAGIKMLHVPYKGTPQ